MATDMETTKTSASTLSDWAAPYVTTMLGKAEALSNLPFQPYTGAFTAPESALQTQAFKGIGALTVPQNITAAGQTLGGLATQTQPAYQPGTYSPLQFNQANVQQYMNPYLESVLEPQRREAQRTADIARQQMQSRMAQAGAYGGSRQAIMEAEGQRNLQTLLSDITGKGYAGAYEDAARRLQEQNARDIEAAKFGESSRQFGANLGLDALGRQIQAAQAQGQIGASEAQYGLANLAQQLAAGATQREIEQQGLTADYGQYMREFQYPQQMLEFQRAMLGGIPIQTYVTQTPEATGFEQFVGGAKDIAGLLKTLGIIQ